MNEDERLVLEMKSLLRQKICRIIRCLQQERTSGLETEIQNTMEMMIQLSELTAIDGVVEAFSNGVQWIGQQVDPSQYSHLSVSCRTDSHRRGRPPYQICVEVLEYLIENDFKISEIASILGVSVATIKRRMKDCNLRISDTYSAITDDELQSLVKNIQQQYPHAGYQTTKAILASMGHKVQRQRLRDAVREVDPDGVIFRRLFLSVHRIQRRTYNVRAPRSLWHIDGNHKLIRYR
jgi:hypothetical protein